MKILEIGNWFIKVFLNTYLIDLNNLHLIQLVIAIEESF